MYNVSTMEKGGFEWDSDNIGHIKKHKVSPGEAGQVLINDPLYPPEGAVASYVLIAILKKRLGLEASLHEILQVLSLNLFEKTPILRACRGVISQPKLGPIYKQINLLDL